MLQVTMVTPRVTLPVAGGRRGTSAQHIHGPWLLHPTGCLVTQWIRLISVGDGEAAASERARL